MVNDSEADIRLRVLTLLRAALYDFRLENVERLSSLSALWLMR